MSEHQDESISRLSEEEIIEQMRQWDLEIDKACIKLGATAQVAVEMLRNMVVYVTDIAETLRGIPTSWGAVGAEQLLDACQQARLTRSNREGQILLSLPKRGDDVAQWLHDVRLVDDNAGLLSDAGQYALVLIRDLRAACAEVAARLSEIDDPEAQVCAQRLRALAEEPPSRWAAT